MRYGRQRDKKTQSIASVQREAEQSTSTMVTVYKESIAGFLNTYKGR